MSLPHAESVGPGADRVFFSDPQAPIEPHTVDVPAIGRVLMRHAAGANVALIAAGCEHRMGADRIASMLVAAGCKCGCAAAGRGLVLTPTAEHARHIGEQLIALAEATETAAADAAAVALRRAAGK